jgi:hypothetical protein
MDPTKKLTEREKLAACEALDHIEDKKLAETWVLLFDYNPFEKNKLMLPSEVRKRSILLLKAMIMKGQLSPIKEA